MNILHFSTADASGGSARSASRIHNELRRAGHVSRMLVGRKTSKDPDVDTVFGGRLGRFGDRLAEGIGSRLGFQYWYFPSQHRVRRHPWLREADIVQLYNLHGGYFSIRMLPEISRQKPVVWRLSDMWPMTPHAAYTYGCECWKKGPDSCVCELSFYPPIGRNTKHFLWKMKEKLYAQSTLTIVAPSSWAERLARESILLSRFPVRRIPNGIDLDIFYPRDRAAAREALGIENKTKVILFSAHGIDNNPRKGSEHVLETIERLGKVPNALLLLAGKGGEQWAQKISSLPVRALGFISDAEKMAHIYSSADCILVPSVVENLPNTLLEAMACAVPAVAFDTGGIGDAVRHRETGYLAPAGDCADLAQGITLLFSNDRMRNELSKNARELIEREFNKTLETQRFENLYRELI